MSLLHDAYTALLAGLTYKTGNEIHWYGKDGYPITVEPVDVGRESYIIRCYYVDGGLCREVNYHQDQLHGKYQWWYPNGQLRWEENYHHGQQHGRDAWWREDGTLQYERHYIYGRIATREEWEQHNDTAT